MLLFMYLDKWLAYLLQEKLRDNKWAYLLQILIKHSNKIKISVYINWFY